MKHDSLRHLMMVLATLSLAMMACAPFTTFAITPAPASTTVAVQPTQGDVLTDEPATGSAPTETDVPTSTDEPTEIAATNTVVPAELENDVSVHYQAMREGFETDVDAYANGSRYAVSLQIKPDGSAMTIVGQEQVRFLNNTSDSMNEVIFRLYPNALSADDYLFVGSVSVNGEQQEPELLSQNTALRVTLSEPLNPNEAVDIDLGFRLQLPDNRLLGAGRIANDDGVVVLSSFLPLLSVYEEGEWWTDFPAGNGDPAFSASALFDVTLTAPSQMEVSSSGTTIETNDVGNALREYRFVTGPMRDFSLSLANEFELTSSEFDGITINIWSAEGSQAADDFALEVTTESIRIFNEAFGEYPFSEIDVVESPMNGAAGIEYPGVYYVENELWDQNEFFYEVVLAHETAHQWWYSVIGNNQIDEPWIDEALADYSVEVYYRERYGDEAGDSVREAYESDVRAWLADNNPSKPVGLPVTSYSSPEYGVFVYRAGALLYSHLAQEYGKDNVYNMLHDYYQRFRYGIAHSEDIEELVRIQLGAEAADTFEEIVYGQ